MRGGLLELLQAVPMGAGIALVLVQRRARPIRKSTVDIVMAVVKTEVVGEFPTHHQLLDESFLCLLRRIARDDLSRDGVR